MMICEGHIGAYDICRGDPDIPVDLIKLQFANGDFQQREMGAEYIHHLPQTFEAEEGGIMRQDINLV
ncbi:hypothetical protein HZA38_01325 [Candidatus Peregrinibacteria bacterium]|nr:hypothetical protein [Candidatus Peregrinibacteria bacterium]